MDVGEFVKWALTVDVSQLSVPGLLLAFIVIFVYALHKEHIVMGGRWRDDQAANAKREAALDACNASVKKTSDDYTDARIEITRLRAEREFSAAPPPRRRGASND